MPGDLQAEIRGSAVQVSWVPDPALADAPAHLQASGYRVWRMEEDRYGELQLTATQDVESAHANDSGQRVEWTDAVPDPRPDWFYYQVATRIGDTVGPATALVSASTAPTQSVVVQPPGTPPGTPDPDPPVDTTAPPMAVPVTLESTQGSSLALKMVPGGTTTVSGFTLRRGQARDAVNYFHARVGRVRQEWLRLRQAGTGAAGASGQATPYVYGWVPLTAVEGGRDWQRQSRLLPQPPFVRVSGTGTVPVRVGPATGYTEYLTQIDRERRLAGGAGPERVLAADPGGRHAQGLGAGFPGGRDGGCDGRAGRERGAAAGAGGAGGHGRALDHGDAGERPLP